MAHYYNKDTQRSPVHHIQRVPLPEAASLLFVSPTGKKQRTSPEGTAAKRPSKSLASSSAQPHTSNSNNVPVSSQQPRRRDDASIIHDADFAQLVWARLDAMEDMILQLSIQVHQLQNRELVATAESTRPRLHSSTSEDEETDRTGALLAVSTSTASLVDGTTTTAVSPTVLFEELQSIRTEWQQQQQLLNAQNGDSDTRKHKKLHSSPLLDGQQQPIQVRASVSGFAKEPTMRVLSESPRSSPSPLRAERSASPTLSLSPPATLDWGSGAAQREVENAASKRPPSSSDDGQQSSPQRVAPRLKKYWGW